MEELLSRLVTKDIVEDVARQVCGPNANVESFSFKEFSNNFCNLSQIKTVVTQGTGGSEERSFLVKHSPPTAGSDDNTPYRHRAFKKEAFFYSTLAPLINDLLKKEGESPMRIPGCYYTNHQTASPGEELIIFEDMRDKGFETSKTWILDEEHAQLVLQEIVKLHSGSYLLQQDQLGLIERFPLLKESFMIKGMSDGLTTMFRTGAKEMSKICCDPHLSQLKSWVDKIEPNTLEFITKFLDPTKPFSTICHGDLHSNNVLFKYDDKGKPVDVCLVDFQVIRVMPLFIDIGYLTFLTIPIAQCRQLLPKLLEGYFERMAAILKNKIPFSLEEFLAGMKENDGGMLYGLLMLPFAVSFYQNQTGTTTSENIYENKENLAKIIASTGRMGDIITVVMGLAEEANRLKFYQKYQNVEEFLWKFD